MGTHKHRNAHAPVRIPAVATDWCPANVRMYGKQASTLHRWSNPGVGMRARASAHVCARVHTPYAYMQRALNRVVDRHNWMHTGAPACAYACTCGHVHVHRSGEATRAHLSALCVLLSHLLRRIGPSHVPSNDTQEVSGAYPQP